MQAGMRRCDGMKVFVAALVVALAAGGAEAAVTGMFGVDYGAGAQAVQAGFVGRNVSGTGTTSVSSTITDPFDPGTGDVTVTLAGATDQLRGINRDNLTGSAGLNDLVDDIVINDQMAGNRGDDMTLTLSGLPGGVYDFVGFFNDSFFNPSTGSDGLSGQGVALYIGANDGTPDATAIVSDYRDSNLSDPIASAMLTLISDGVNPVIVTLAGTTSGDTRFAFNGFTLDAVAVIPEPASAALLGVGGLMMMRRRR